MSGGGTGLMSGGGVSMMSGGRGKSGEDGCSIMTERFAMNAPTESSMRHARMPAEPYTSSPTARISASALLRSTTPGRIL